MSHIKTELIEQSVPLYSVRLIEGLRLFDLIQENSPEPKSTLTRGNLESFLQKFSFPGPPLKASKIIYQICRDGNDITSDLFAAGIANYLKHVELTNEQSLFEFYNKLKEVLSFSYQKPLQRYQQWDIDSNMTPQALKDRQNNIGAFYSELHPFIEGMQLYMFQNFLERLNYCLSVTSISSNESEVFKVYKTFINPTVMNHISDFLVTIGQLEVNPQQVNSQLLQNVLSQKQNMVNYFDLISHFYSACNYRELKERLETTPCLFYHETYKTILLAIKIPEVKIQHQVAICLCMMSRYIQTFNDWALSDMYNHLMPLLTSVSLIKDEETVYFTLICLKNIMRSYQKRTQYFKADQKNHEMLERIQTFSLFELGLYNNYDLQKECFLLIAEILKVCPVNYKQIEELKLTTKVFVLQMDYQAALVPAALTILEVSIHRKLDDITNMIINDPSFLACLENNFGVKESIFFYQFLHIVYLLSYTHTNYLFEKNLLAKTLEMMFEGTNPTPTVSSIGSDILLNAVQQALQNEQILEILYEKLVILDRVMPFLFTKCFAKSDYLNLLLSQNNNVPNYNYFDKYILNNFFKILYSLAVGVSRKHKKYAFLKRVNEEIINSISKILDDMFNSDNRQLIEIVLREKVKISSKKLKLQNGIPLFKLIAIILQEITYIQDNCPLPILKTINRQVKSFGRSLLKSQAFTLHELEVQNIPVYIKVIIEYDKSKIVRDIPHKFELSSLKAYVKQLVIKGVDRKLNEVKDVTLKYKQNGRIIENEVQYRALVSKNLEKRVTEFAWLVEDVKWRNRREDAMISSFILPNYEQNTRSYREPNHFVTSRQPMNLSRQLSNVGGSRLNQTMRQNAEDSNTRKNYSPINFNYTYGDRARSPAFGGSGGNRNR